MSSCSGFAAVCARGFRFGAVTGAAAMLLILGGPAKCQTSEALVLSGGGSRGMAHVGVLIGLERLGYDPDLVVGTSMGALIGALYAAGYSPAELQRQVEAVNWGEMFTSAPLVVGPEQVPRYPQISLDREARTLRFNRGFVPQWRINRALVHLLFDANARILGDFDRLPRRFRAVAADLETGDPVVLASGDLSRAIRASMAVPGIFAPVEWDNRYLVDGGIARNLPTGKAREMGAQRIIAVDVGRPPATIEGWGPVSVLSRALDLMQEQTQQDTIPPDVLVVPDIPPRLRGFTFPGDPGPLIRIGLEAVEQEVEPASGDRRGAGPLPPPPETFGSLVLEAPDSAVAALARRVFGPLIGSPYSSAAVLHAVDRLYTTGLFEGVWPRVVAGEGGDAPALHLRLESPPKFTLAGATGYDTDLGGRVWAALTHNRTLYRAPVVLTAAASADRLQQWMTGSAQIFSLRIFPLLWSVGAYFQETDVRRFEAQETLEDQEVQRRGAWLGLEFQRLLHQQSATALLRAERIEVEDGVGGMSYGPMLRWSSPRPQGMIVGIPFGFELEARWGDIAYQRARLGGSVGGKISELRIAAVGDLTITSVTTPVDARPSLGDEHLVPGFRWGQQRGRARMVAGLDIAYPTPLHGFIRSRIRSAAAPSAPADLLRGANWGIGADLGIVWRTPFGALSASWGSNTWGEQQFLLDIGAYL